MVAYQFLSPEWTEEARRLRAEYADRVPSLPAPVRMNLVVNDTPFGEGSIDAHLDTSDGEFVLESGHLEPADLKVTIDYETAKAIFIEGNPQAAMQAFMAGRIRVEGDMTKLLALQGAPTDPLHVEMAHRMREITE
ncbi:MAG TPA: SCP2 sterol-binding domain-containing protein [Acidimicrobiales bacterium]|nr:SCP2 sterol-binding domain-containing protein [Acidimicrobiales bacterium]